MVDAPQYKIFPVDDALDALRDIRAQYINGQKPLNWKGLDSLHFSVSAGAPSPSWYFSEEGLAYEEERGRDFWDVYTIVAIQLGVHNGTVREEKNTTLLHKIIEDYKEIISARYK